MCKRQAVYLLFLILLSMGSMAMRIVQYIFAVDAQKGYFEANSASVLGFSILAVASIILFISSIFSLRDEIVSLNTKLSSNLANISCILLLTTTIGNMFIELSNITRANKAIFALIYIVFASLFCVFLLVAIFNSKKLFPAMFLIPVLYCIARLIELFIKYTGIKSIASKTFEILALCALILFFLYYSKSMIKNTGKKRTFAFGMCAIFLIVVSVIPSVLFMHKAEVGNNIAQFFISQIHYIAFALLILTIIVPSKQTKEQYKKLVFEKENAFNIYEDEEDYIDIEDNEEDVKEYADFQDYIEDEEEFLDKE